MALRGSLESPENALTVGHNAWSDFGEDLSGQQAVVEGDGGHYGPPGLDAAGTWYSERALIAHRRLAVVDIQDQLGLDEPASR